MHLYIYIYIYMCVCVCVCVSVCIQYLREVRLVWQAHQNWTIEDWKTLPDQIESRLLLQHSDGRVRICRKEHESMDPSCLVSTVQAGGVGVMVWGIFSWHTLGPLVQIEHHLNATAYLSIVACVFYMGVIHWYTLPILNSLPCSESVPFIQLSPKSCEILSIALSIYSVAW